MVMKTKDNRNKPHHSERLSIWFSQSKCIMNTKKNTVFGKRLAIFCHFWAKTDFFLCWRLCNPEYVAPQPVPKPGGRQ